MKSFPHCHCRDLSASIQQTVLQPRRMLNSHSSGHHSSGHHSSHSSSGSHSSHGGHHSNGGHHTSGGHHHSSGSHHGSSNHDSSQVDVGHGRNNPAYAAYGNPIDDCWMGGNQGDPKSLARCATGFGRNARGGASGDIYHVTTAADDVVNPQPGMLRYGLTRVSRTKVADLNLVPVAGGGTWRPAQNQFVTISIEEQTHRGRSLLVVAPTASCLLPFAATWWILLSPAHIPAACATKPHARFSFSCHSIPSPRHAGGAPVDRV